MASGQRVLQLLHLIVLAVSPWTPHWIIWASVWVPEVAASLSSQISSDAALAGQGRVLQADEAAEVEIVTTAEALQAAVLAGKPHIQIEAHLDLTTLEMVDGDLLGRNFTYTQSIRVSTARNSLPSTKASVQCICHV